MLKISFNLSAVDRKTIELRIPSRRVGHRYPAEHVTPGDVGHLTLIDNIDRHTLTGLGQSDILKGPVER